MAFTPVRQAKLVGFHQSVRGGEDGRCDFNGGATDQTGQAQGPRGADEERSDGDGDGNGDRRAGRHQAAPAGQPAVQRLPGGARQRRAVAGRVAAQDVQVDAGPRQLDGVPRQPFLQVGAQELRMELQAQRMTSGGEGLAGRAGTASGMHAPPPPCRAGRQGSADRGY
jgi:hypothetical protein